MYFYCNRRVRADNRPSGTPDWVRSVTRRRAHFQRLARTCAVVRYPQERVLTKADPNPTSGATATNPTWLIAVRAAESKKATDIRVLDLTGITSFADYFVICTGANQRQIQAIADEVGLQMKHQARELPNSVEGYNQAEWVLADYGDLLVHVFSPKARDYYDLERLWRSAKTVEIPAE
jgi:ribosome-associated protein